MKFFEDIVACRPLIEEAINRFGYSPEHNFHWYQYCANEEKGEKNVFVGSEIGDGLFTVLKKKSATVFSSPIASRERRVPLLLEYFEAVFEMPNVKKVWLELETSLRKDLLKALPEKFKANRLDYTLTWPLMNLKTFDASLPGGHFKYLRKAKHKFYRSHQVAVVNANTFSDKARLHKIVDDWKDKRPVNERAFPACYHNIIDSSFEGMVEARIFMVDGNPVGINAGWMVPNSNRFYGGVGIHNYAVPDLGSMLYLEDLEFLKSQGYTEADMGGSWHGGLKFKDEFLPESHHKTHIFSVVKK
jgi:hypothetical protein